ncbi:MAG: hypothetical protein KJ666_13985 [Bacteroidetes bacterium]|nr:hypothetical protein [Bacteroidota bacterium]
MKTFAVVPALVGIAVLNIQYKKIEPSSHKSMMYLRSFLVHNNFQYVPVTVINIIIG